MRAAATLLLFAACHSDSDSTKPAPTYENTKVVVSEALDAEVPDCTIHNVSESFAVDRATLAGTVRVEGDYTRTLGKITVERTGGGGWTGTFNGPRDLLFDDLRAHLCTAAHVYALKPSGNNNPTTGPVMLTAYELKPDEKADVDTLCHAMAHALDAGPLADEHDRVAMQWFTDRVTTTKWDAWRKTFARSRTDLYARKADASELFHARGAELEAAASALGISCPTATEWKKR
jgi:hypothetical protein